MVALGSYFERRTPSNSQAQEVTALWSGLNTLSKITGVRLQDILSRIHQAAKGQEAFRASIELFVLEYENADEASFEYFERCKEYIDRACDLSLAVFNFTDQERSSKLPLAYIARVSRYCLLQFSMLLWLLNDDQKSCALDASMANYTPIQGCRSHLQGVFCTNSSDFICVLRNGCATSSFVGDFDIVIENAASFLFYIEPGSS